MFEESLFIQKSKLGSLVVKKNLATSAQVEQAIKDAKNNGHRLGEELINQNIITEKQLKKLLNKQSQYRYALAMIASMIGAFQANASFASTQTPSINNITTNVTAPLQRQKAQNESEYSSHQAIEQWKNFINGIKSLSDYEKVEKVNAYFNHIRYMSDQKLWKTKDYWATPEELLEASAGDCEDFAIAKYVTLKEAGVSGEKLRITYVQAVDLNQAHMVLAFYPSERSDPLILDNLTPEVLPITQRNDLVSVYSFNDQGLWVSTPGGQGTKVGKGDDVKLWAHVKQRRAHNGSTLAQLSPR